MLMPNLETPGPQRPRDWDLQLMMRQTLPLT
jgi:hypothetical protein